MVKNQNQGKKSLNSQRRRGLVDPKPGAQRPFAERSQRLTPVLCRIKPRYQSIARRNYGMQSGRREEDGDSADAEDEDNKDNENDEENEWEDIERASFKPSFLLSFFP